MAGDVHRLNIYGQKAEQKDAGVGEEMVSTSFSLLCIHEAFPTPLGFGVKVQGLLEIFRC